MRIVCEFEKKQLIRITASLKEDKDPINFDIVLKHYLGNPVLLATWRSSSLFVLVKKMF